jgi:PelA/Pel-15E family pectate lyase
MVLSSPFWQMLPFILTTTLTPASSPGALPQTQTTVAWSACLRQPPGWYASAEAARIADNVLLYQRDNGGWKKNVDMARPLSEADRAALIRDQGKDESTIDNGATHTQLVYLARVYSAGKQERFKTAFLRGLEYLLAAQYPNGGWPQYYPLRSGYYSHITFNDDAMVGVLSLLRNVARKEADYAFVNDARRVKAEQAVQKGIACILKCQVTVSGKKTVWCAQHDEKTLVPAPARSYEKISLSGSESVGIVRFLMGIERPSQEVREAIESAVAWLREAALHGIRVEQKPDLAAPKGYDRVVVQDAAAPPIWARFYEIGTNRPLFCGRDGVIKYSLKEIEYERRNGYAWYVSSPDRLLSHDYPAWKREKSASESK